MKTQPRSFYREKYLLQNGRHKIQRYITLRFKIWLKKYMRKYLLSRNKNEFNLKKKIMLKILGSQTKFYSVVYSYVKNIKTDIA